MKTLSTHLHKTFKKSLHFEMYNGDFLKIALKYTVPTEERIL